MGATGQQVAAGTFHLGTAVSGHSALTVGAQQGQCGELTRVPRKDTFMSESLVPVKVTLFGSEVCAGDLGKMGKHESTGGRTRCGDGGGGGRDAGERHPGQLTATKLPQAGQVPLWREGARP